MRRMWFTRTFVVALWLATPAFAAIPSVAVAANGPELNNSAPDVARPAMPPPDVSAKPQTATTDPAKSALGHSTEYANGDLKPPVIHSVAAPAGSGRRARAGRRAAAPATATAATGASQLRADWDSNRRKFEFGGVYRQRDTQPGALAHWRGPWGLGLTIGRP